MKKYVDLCVGCTALGMLCKGEGCPYFKPVPLPFCDKCDEEITDNIYEVDGEELCEECLKARFLKK